MKYLIDIVNPFVISFCKKLEKKLRLPFGQKVILNFPTSSKATTTEKEGERGESKRAEGLTKTQTMYFSSRGIQFYHKPTPKFENHANSKLKKTFYQDPKLYVNSIFFIRKFGGGKNLHEIAPCFSTVLTKTQTCQIHPLVISCSLAYGV